MDEKEVALEWFYILLNVAIPSNNNSNSHQSIWPWFSQEGWNNDVQHCFHCITMCLLNQLAFDLENNKKRNVKCSWKRKFHWEIWIIDRKLEGWYKYNSSILVTTNTDQMGNHDRHFGVCKRQLHSSDSSFTLGINSLSSTFD